MANRVFVGFDSEDIQYFYMMKAWSKNKHIDFEFIDLQISNSINSENEQYIKVILRKKINKAGTFIQLIGKNTKHKHKYVRWEAETAIEKQCRIIGVNLNKSMLFDDELTPNILKNIGSIFIPFNSKIIKYALDNYVMNSDGNWIYGENIYNKLGIQNDGRRIY